jgi:hypothetical protein
LIPYFSDDEYGEVLRICSIFLLAYLLPYSTGMDYYLTQNMSTFNTEKLAVDDYIIQMPLEERLEKSVIHSLSSNQYGNDEFTTIMDQDCAVAFGDLLDRISSLLQRRPLHSHQIDILHLFAMMIYPYHAHTYTSKSFEIFPINNSPAREKAIRLMENSLGLQFQIHYGHRRQIVQMVHRYIMIPKGIPDYTPLYAGALPHLFASLRQFCCNSCEDHLDSLEALNAIVALAVQCRWRNDEGQDDFSFLQSEFDWIVHRMMEERPDNPCPENCMEMSNNFEANMDDRQTAIPRSCHYFTYGRTLSNLFIRINRTRQDINFIFILNVAQTLAELIEWQVDSWTVYPDDDGHINNIVTVVPRKKYSPCLLVSLLHAAKHVFCCLTAKNMSDIDVNNDDDPFALMITSSLTLLRHSHYNIVSAAAELLVKAFDVKTYNKIDQFASILCNSFTGPFTKLSKIGPFMRSLIGVASSKSCHVAAFLCKYLLICVDQLNMNNVTEEGKQIHCSLTLDEASVWLYITISNCPMVASKHLPKLLTLVEDTVLPLKNRLQLAKTLLCNRLNHYFLNDCDKIVCSSVKKVLTSDCNDSWVKYMMGCHAIVAGNFGLASDIFRSVLDKCSAIDSTQYLWISILERVSSAEMLLCDGTLTETKCTPRGNMGIPGASTALYSAVSYMETLSTMCTTWESGGIFQLRFLLLRLDFLDLITIIRHLLRESQLTGKSPAVGTRSCWHLQNVVKGFDYLARRYRDLYRQYAMCFRNNQSIISLGILQSLSSFMATAIRVCYSEMFLPSKSNFSHFEVDSDVNHPLVAMMRRLYELVIRPMTVMNMADQRLRATAILETIEGVMLVPSPIPIDFLSPRPSSIPDLSISADTNPVFKSFDESLSIIETAPLIGFSFYVFGRLSVDFLQRSKVPAWTIIVWFRMAYSSPLVVEDEEYNDVTGTENISNDDELSLNDSKANDVQNPDLSSISPTASPISDNGFFFFEVECPPVNEEGYYTLCTKLGIRDVRGNDWEIPSWSPNSFISRVRVSRSRSVLQT